MERIQLKLNDTDVEAVMEFARKSLNDNENVLVLTELLAVIAIIGQQYPTVFKAYLSVRVPIFLI